MSIKTLQLFQCLPLLPIKNPSAFFSVCQHSQLKGCVTKDKKILLSSQNVPNNWFLNIYSQQNSTYLDSGQICKIMQIQILASTFIIPGFGTFRVEFTFCVERLKGKDKIPGGCKFLYHPNVRNSCSHIPNLPPQCGGTVVHMHPNVVRGTNQHYQPNVSPAQPQCAANCPQIYLSGLVTIIIISRWQKMIIVTTLIISSYISS